MYFSHFLILKPFKEMLTFAWFTDYHRL